VTAPESDVDLVGDLNSEDESGLPWTLLDETRDPTLIGEGAWLVVGEGRHELSPQFELVEIEGDIVWCGC
jgi:hypothetical protein